MDIRKIKKLIDLIQESDVAEIEISEIVMNPISQKFFNCVNYCVRKTKT